jgi:hypothetical protein
MALAHTVTQILMEQIWSLSWHLGLKFCREHGMARLLIFSHRMTFLLARNETSQFDAWMVEGKVINGTMDIRKLK